MKNYSYRSIILSSALLLFNIVAIAQDRQGNIVEYFGKEKVTDVNEGKVIHIFDEGLVLGQDRFYLNSNTTPKDPVFGSYLLNPEYKIREGKEENIGNDGKIFTWESLGIKENSEFNDRRLRSGYLFLEYESDKAKTVLFEASGHTNILINGMPHEGDHYDFGYSLIPIELKKGTNEFLLNGGRFPRMRARLLDPRAVVQITTRDMTLPDILKEVKENLKGGIRVVNSSGDWFEKGIITCEINGVSADTKVPKISPLNSRKVPFNIPVPENLEENRVASLVTLKDSRGRILSRDTVRFNVKSKYSKHKRTFISGIDGSVQYYSIAPSSNDTISNPAMFLSVHGASVEAVNQANAYAQKDWGHLVAPTNRRPFGFAWEDWGRIDAMEVLNHAEELLGTDPQHTYLTGHSMGGHGSWYLGATYPDRFAAVAPAAGYPDLLGYRESFRKRLKNMTDEELSGYGMTRERANEMVKVRKYSDPSDIAIDSMIRRAGNPSRTLKLKRNYLHHGIYILHGEKDTVVPTFIAREMREVMAKFHPDFTYYEYPEGTHWYGNHSVDWSPIFDFFKFRSIKPSHEINKLEFYTGSPGVSASSHFGTIVQQIAPFGISSFTFERYGYPEFTTDNVKVLAIDIEEMGGESDTLSIDGQIFKEIGSNTVYFKKNNQKWSVSEKPSLKEKGPHRNGGFKDAFRNNFVLVYGTKGSRDEDEWYYNRARNDAEKFWYRGNGNVEIIKDTDFSPSDYRDRNVILYGNSDNNAAWNSLLKNCPLQVSDNRMIVGDKTLEGDNYGAYFIYRREDSDIASVGVVTATGNKGMKAAYANHYLVNGTTFPDVLIFNETVLKEGIPGVQSTGFFGNDWSVENGDFVWKN